jgi:glycosyltransferase involved in cell wall biosynthesis
MPILHHLAVNARVTAFAMGGQQRVTAEILKRLPQADNISPGKPLGGAKGHVWEQCVLPARAWGRLLWSPSATGPLLHARQVVTVHDTAFFDVPEYFSPSFVRLYQALIPRLVRRVARVVTVSEYARRQLTLHTGLDPSRIDVILNGVSAQFCPQLPASIAATRAAMDLPTRYVLVQATADRRKNLARTLDAWRLAAPALPDDLHLVVSGNMSRTHVFGEGAINTDGPRIRMVGFVAEEHMAPLMAGAEAFLFASLYEGFGLPVLEAMAVGTPVITGDATSLPEVAGGHALLVKANDTHSIAAGLLRLMGDAALQDSMRQAGLAHAQRFTWDEAARQYGELFARL